MRNVLAIACCAAVAFVFSAAQDADARPDYLKQFKKDYPKAVENGVKTCAACHPEKDKKVRTDYAKAFGKALGASKVKDAKKIAEALKKAEGEKSAVDGKTYGDLLKDGKDPNSK